jgi:2-desacetyl-2-hydroxyethyl bacteriochlorophyllide A dehydrogenase
MNRRALVFTGPRRVELVDEPLPDPGPGQVLVEASVSAISAGTELLAFRGQIPPELPLDDTLGALAGGTFTFPFRFGYASVGQVRAHGPGAREWLGRTVFAFHPHASHFVVPAEDVVPVPPAVPPGRAAMLALMETAVNLVLDGRPLIGERVVVVGQGMVGLLTTALLARFPLESLQVIEAVPLRAEAARALGARVVAPPEAGDADLVYELSGDPAALDVALAAAGREGRVIVGSWYGSKRAPVDLGGSFHRGRLTISSSQVSRVAPSLTARWDRARRFATAWRALAALDEAALVTHTIPFAEAQQAYELLERSPDRALQVLLLHDTHRGER